MHISEAHEISTTRRPRFGRLHVGLALSAFLVTAQPSAANEAPGPAVGERAVEFSLPDSRGETHTLASLLAPERYLALVFYRSADW